MIAAIDYGREVRTRGARIHVIGRREVARAGSLGVELSAYEGVHVVLAEDGSIITAYRNKQIDVRPRSRRSRRSRRNRHPHVH